MLTEDSSLLNAAKCTLGCYEGAISTDFDQEWVGAQLKNINAWVRENDQHRLSHGGDYVIKAALCSAVGELPVAIKVFKRQTWIKDWFDRRHKSKAERSFRAAEFLGSKGLGTPAPIAWLERWDKGRLLESYYVCRFEPAVSFRDALAQIYYDLRDNQPLMDLLCVVAPAIKAMHDAGFMHGDMGNQNILLPRDEDGRWLKPQFIDLNRSAIKHRPLSFKERAFDLSRIGLPGAYLKIFKTIYWEHQDPPKDFDKQETRFRRRFEWHMRSRKYRRPFRHLRNRHHKPVKPIYPPPQDIWLWDEKSAQPMIVLGRKEKHRYRDFRYMLSMWWQTLVALPGLIAGYRKLLPRSYQQPVFLAGRIGIAIHPKADYLQHELPLLKALGNPPVLIRFYHHENMNEWRRAIAVIDALHQQGIEIMIALLQDRRALLDPASWEAFLRTVISATAGKVAHIEITHASNRLKWGIWNAREYRQLVVPALALRREFPQIKITGPACIDFEYHPIIAALNAIPAGQSLDALSHLLYVDRRGSPESKQGAFSTLEKCALLKALAQTSKGCGDEVIISEVNWPIRYTGIWSPIGCPYETPKWRREQPGESEEDYANYMLRYLVIAVCSGHIAQVFWWRLSAHGYGLVDDRDNFRPRAAFKALAFFLQTLGQSRFIKKLPTDDYVYAFEFQTHHQTVVMAWCDKRDSIDVSTALPAVPYTKIFSRDGNIIPSARLSGAPIYLLRELSLS